jgi:hypothetical protein
VLGIPVPRKPRAMHWKTYDRHATELRSLEAKLADATEDKAIKDLERFLATVERLERLDALQARARKR